MERDKELKQILNDGGLKKAPKMFKHNLMAELMRQQEFQKSLQKPFIRTSIWWLLGSVTTASFGMLIWWVSTDSNIGQSPSANPFQMVYSNIEALDYTNLIVPAGILFLLFIEVLLRKRFQFKST